MANWVTMPHLPGGAAISPPSGASISRLTPRPPKNEIQLFTELTGIVTALQRSEKPLLNPSLTAILSSASHLAESPGRRTKICPEKDQPTEGSPENHATFDKKASEDHLCFSYSSLLPKISGRTKCPSISRACFS